MLIADYGKISDNEARCGVFIMRKIILGLIVLLVIAGCSSHKKVDLDTFITNYNKVVGETEQQIDHDQIGDIQADIGNIQMIYYDENIDISVSYDDKDKMAYRIVIYGDIENGIMEAKAMTEALSLDVDLFEEELEKLLDSDDMFSDYENRGKTITLANIAETELYMFQFKEPGFEEE